MITVTLIKTFLPIIAIMIIGSIFILWIKNKTLAKEYSIYQAKEILNENENLLYEILKKYLDESHIIFTKVRIEDIIEVNPKIKNKNRRAFETARNRIKSKHFDFIICDKRTKKTQRIIELDGNSHKKENEIQKDEFKNRICKITGLKLIRIKNEDLNTPEKVIKKIIES